MRRKLLFIIVAAVVVFGLCVSGCNRNQGKVALRQPTRSKPARSARPAEVLAASAYRPPQYQTVAAVTTPVPPPTYYAQDGYYSAPEPAIVSSPYLAMAQSSWTQPATTTYVPAPATSYSQAPAVYAQPTQTQQITLARAPIPELEPPRLYQLPANASPFRPAAEIMISERQTQPYQSQNVHEVKRALAPLESHPVAYNAHNNWVSSPVTAMSYGQY